MLIPAIAKNSTTGYKNVSYIRGKKKFEAQVQDGGTRLHLGYFNTADEAATAYARSEYGRADAAKLLQPRPAATPAGAEAIRQVEREGLALTASSSSNTGYKGVRHCPKQRGSKKYNLELPVYELSILTPEQMAANPTYSPSSNLDYLLWNKLFRSTPVSDIGERLDGASN
ncbi:hypothetical protein EMIHUDRAFT_260516 [Emiliania huxleyi CCMP1516]|uniref:AP2/ERF domain-containing protein n=2 Tax=Emiliania huxleyi TaxID=2903 RepID=A0A0D3JQW5_EMIH1|nr:hypothetical protein EMIHUDRAFT_254549 [Emiliania huxleyi CCMP1516]XP_005791550.1 hypothetical protein EMIHUDRAFT_260516 [Emiliania huxleyi CCMP1516]EOD25900.1 hypothetical protein EMIHUDRAFT_254549 [Emiliania huxleyi CCMP1516]EOD39121.1 hypothetical protein EMIHUDRAFT_260516 [Emiliania huxleyi CCMP1516]|eukprot:XP_005778329.1 hypothetical protein EMIHUDRAFT_254549 [Emiliania huxleyi CCMP1516]